MAVTDHQPASAHVQFACVRRQVSSQMSGPARIVPRHQVGVLRPFSGRRPVPVDRSGAASSRVCAAALGRPAL